MKRLVFLCRGFAVLLAGLIVSGVLVAPAVAAETENLAYMPAREQIKRFKAGTLSPVDVLQAQIARVYQYNGELNTTGEPIWKYLEHNGKVNGITYEHFDEAMKMAKESEKRYRNGTARPLEGITVAVKDEHAVKGWRGHESRSGTERKTSWRHAEEGLWHGGDCLADADGCHAVLSCFDRPE